MRWVVGGGWWVRGGWRLSWVWHVARGKGGERGVVRHRTFPPGAGGGAPKKDVMTFCRFPSAAAPFPLSFASNFSDSRAEDQQTCCPCACEFRRRSSRPAERPYSHPLRRPAEAPACDHARAHVPERAALPFWWRSRAALAANTALACIAACADGHANFPQVPSKYRRWWRSHAH